MLLLLLLLCPVQVDTVYICYGTYQDGTTDAYVNVGNQRVDPKEIEFRGDILVVKGKEIKYKKHYIYTGVVNCDGSITYRYPDGSSIIITPDGKIYR